MGADGIQHLVIVCPEAQQSDLSCDSKVTAGDRSATPEKPGTAGQHVIRDRYGAHDRCGAHGRCGPKVLT